MVVGGDNLKQQLKMNGGSNNFIVDGGDTFITMSAVMFASNGYQLHTFHEAKFLM